MNNILFVHSSSELYGSDRSLLNIVKNIDKQKFKVFVVLPCHGPLVDEMIKLKNVKVDIFEIAVLRRKNLSIKGGLEYYKNFRNSMKYLNKYIKENQIDIVDTNTAVVFPGAVAAKKYGIKSVWHIREIIKNKFENKVISFMMNKYADIIVANSKSTGDALLVNKEKIRVVYNAVEENSDFVKREHVNLTVGMAGRINRWKGQTLFVDMAKIVNEHFPDVVFQIAGEAYIGEEYLKDELQKYIIDKGLYDKVILLGQVNDMKAFYEGLDVFVLPSIQPEPFGLVVIEAMDYSIPVVATKHGGPVEIITEGEDGFLVDFNSANEMAERVEKLLADKELRLKMGSVAKANKKAKFSIPAMVNGIESAFDEVMKV